jgi:hypothetical protein
MTFRVGALVAPTLVTTAAAPAAVDPTKVPLGDGHVGTTPNVGYL